MLDVADCLTKTHDWKLVVLAGTVCVLASTTAFTLFPRILHERVRSNRSIWFVLTTLVAGSGIWATHFIAMLAFDPVLPIAFELGSTVSSYLVSVALTGCAFAVLALVAGRSGRVTAGVILGLATVAMHYLGISGLRIPGAVGWNPPLVALSAVFSVLFATSSLLVAGSGTDRLARRLGGLLFALSIVALHFTGMAAITLVPDPTVALPNDLLSGDRLAYGIGAVMVLIIGCGAGARFIDRRSRHANDERLRFLARHDMLTSLPNRLLFEEVVSREIAAGLNGQRGSALLCLDLDGFKEVNDLFGHAAGDRVLVEVARRLQNLLGERCIAARLGGDEFAILATGLGRLKSAGAAAQSVIDTLSVPFDLDGSRFDIGCSVGVAICPTDGTSYQALLSHADIALARAKADGKGVFRFFESAMDEEVRERRRMAHDLRSALKAGQLRLEYQPQLDVDTNSVCGFEALLRWDHPERGPISPATFVPIAEETGLILPIGEWVLREACREAATWQAPLGVAVNLSIAQFRQSGLAELVGSVLADTGLAPERLEIEVTESLFLESVPRTLKVLEQIKSYGVRIAMDDFGTGYSSLSTLQSFSFDKLKIDQSFTAQLGQTAKGTAIVRAILALAQSLELRVVAEGVETPEQLDFLREGHCNEVQGYLCGRPRPIAAYEDLVDPPAEPARLQYA